MARHATIDEYIAALPQERKPEDVDTKLFADWLVQAREIELAS